MELAIQTAPIGGSMETKLEAASELEVSVVSLGTYDYYGPGPAELDPGTHLDDPDARETLEDQLERHEISIGMLGGGSNPLHPNPDVAENCKREITATLELAERLGVDTVSCHSGLPAGSPDDETPNWLTMPIPPEPHISEGYEYQWEEVAIPFWREIADEAEERGVDVAIEVHVNTLVHTPAKLLRLREETNDRIGAKLDPAHLLLQGMDEIDAIRRLGREDAIHAFEASDIKLDEANVRRGGMLDVPQSERRIDRSWEFRAVGRGHGSDYWRDLVDSLEKVGYDGIVSIQHLGVPEETRAGFETAVGVLDDALSG
ncbi:sugar phosphate isomerase/epimerase [Natrarchaeobius halalkaliphilus]|uniref:Sugar phosphate isomerase/epimerase n=1 Tax=Natrarchaeobius halalkaliphilus TaxID=1679091 RepID=A0A3N6M5C2_9EURY|nr:sugar phosphate isomerase/epimerase [Natrarchaeobius halalkaliphilus]RQG87919.1 sugar phosphate isomerase/epimerase [Natrarchaeobius halalkaliphilus]